MDAAKALHSNDHSGGLSRRERKMLTFEMRLWRYTGAEEQAIGELFDMYAARYYQELNRLINPPEALVADRPLIKEVMSAAVRPPAGQGCKGWSPPARLRSEAAP
ncbi:MAG TPA: DUF3263 domain-containing protein [Pseudonocardiaceae bacterium]|nr:DUF3263 domain-containing protein [Pseudonocardiaceae bacterium]